jgi:hypothetical protein
MTGRHIIHHLIQNQILYQTVYGFSPGHISLFKISLVDNAQSLTPAPMIKKRNFEKDRNMTGRDIIHHLIQNSILYERIYGFSPGHIA